MSNNKPSERISRAQARFYHPSNYQNLKAIWTPDDFDEAAEQAMQLVAEDRATVIDFATREVIE